MTIDWWTLGLETVNVAVLVWLLGRFFWRPVSAMIETRRKQAVSLLDEAEASRAEAKAALAEIGRTREGFAAEREQVLEKARQEAAEQSAALLDKARGQAAAAEAGARAALAAEKAAAEAEWAERSGRLAVEIAGRLMARLSGDSVREAFADWLVAEIGKLPDDARKAVANGGALEAVSAAGIGADEQARIRERIAGALGAAPQIVFTTDPALIAGLELRGPHLAIANSWKADLDSILAGIGHGR
ncbi:ATP synthase subunit b [Aquamicrobium terrae]